MFDRKLYQVLPPLNFEGVNTRKPAFGKYYRIKEASRIISPPHLKLNIWERTQKL